MLRIAVNTGFGPALHKNIAAGIYWGPVPFSPFLFMVKKKKKVVKKKKAAKKGGKKKKR